MSKLILRIKVEKTLMIRGDQQLIGLIDLFYLILILIM